MRTGIWQILLAAGLWGTTGTAQALAPASASPLAIGAVRLLLGGGALLLWAGTTGRLRTGHRWPGRPTAVGALAVATYQLFFFAAVSRTGVAVGTMVAIGSAPVIAGVLSWLIQRERPSRNWTAATTLAVLGVCLLALAATDATLALDAPGILLAVAAGGAYAFFALASKQLLSIQPPDAVTAVLFSLGGLLLLPLLFFVDLTWLAEPSGLLLALELGVVATAFAYILYTRGLQTVAVATAVTLSLAEPLTAAALGLFLVGETLSLSIAAGMLFIVAGLITVAWPRGGQATI